MAEIKSHAAKEGHVPAVFSLLLFFSERDVAGSLGVRLSGKNEQVERTQSG